MATASVPNTFVVATPADPTQVNANFTSLVNFLNNNTVHRDGTRSMTGDLDANSNKVVNLSDGVDPGDAVNKSQLDAATGDVFPPGVVMMYPLIGPPTGWLRCNGQAVSRTIYADLFAVLDVTFGAGDGSTTFNLPDFQDRFPVGVNLGGFASAVGATGGNKDLVVPTHSHNQSLTIGSGSHSHTGVSLSVSATAASAGNHDHGYTAPVNFGTGIGSGTTWSDAPFNTGVDGAHTHSVSGTASGTVGTSSSAHSHTVGGTIDANGVSEIDKNLPPFLALHFIIKT